MTDLRIRQQVQALVGNLASAWTGGAPVLECLAAHLPDSLSPYGAFCRLSDESLEELFASSQGSLLLEAAGQNLEEYMTRETWFDRSAAADTKLAALRVRPVAYFCAEYGLADWLQFYSGGLGILAGDFLKEASDLGLPVVAIGLFYRRGFFNQVLDDSGYQTERYPTFDPADLPVSPVLDSDGTDLVIDVPLGGRIVHARAWALRVGRTLLYLLDTDVPENADPNDRSITANLYGGDQETRVCQEIILGIGGVRMLRRLGIDPSVFSMNEGHAAFLGIELLAESLETCGLDAALQRVRQHVVYTNHTVVPAGNDVFPAALIDRYLGRYAASRAIDAGILHGLATQEDPQWFSMAVLAFRLSGKANAVSHIHARAIHSSWPGFEVEAVTNGVHVPSWLGSEVLSLLDKYVRDWQGDLPDWNRVYDIPPAELWDSRQRQRARMIDFVAGRSGGPTARSAELNPNALTIVWARRFAEYKRAALIAHDLPRLANLMADQDRPVQLIIAGKAHPRDEGGKRMMQQLLTSLAEDPIVARHVVFVPDYNIKVGKYLAQGADLWLNTPRKPLEASGTSGMKSSDNGGLQLTVKDGWADEVEWYETGWGIEGRNDDADATQLYEFLEQSIVPTFYSLNSERISDRWVAMMRHTMMMSLSQYSMRRMVFEYVYKLYMPLSEERESLAATG